jgi:hypothetical protein
MKPFEKASPEDIRIVHEQIGRTPRGMVGVAARAKADDPLGAKGGDPLVVVTSPRVESRRNRRKAQSRELSISSEVLALDIATSEAKPHEFSEDLRWAVDSQGRKSRESFGLEGKASAPKKSSGGALDFELEPFPTTYYLTHPLYAAAISRLEASGYMKELEKMLGEDESLQAKMQRAHERYIEDRNALSQMLGVEDLTRTHPDFSAGGMPHRVKCLHALVGHALATRDEAGVSDNPIGDIALGALA